MHFFELVCRRFGAVGGFSRAGRPSSVSASCLLTLASLLLFPLHAAERVHRIPLDGNQLSARAVVQEILKASGSQVVIPEDSADLKIPAGRLPRSLFVMTWNRALSDKGIALQHSSEAITIRVDKEIIHDEVNAIEAWACKLLGVERGDGTLHAISPEAEGPVIIFVHGLDSRFLYYKDRCKFLADKGYRVYFYEYPNDDRIQRNAERFSRALRTLPADAQEDISIVTVSMVGLITQTMLENEELSHAGVTRFIACAPPFHGSDLAHLRHANDLVDGLVSLVDKDDIPAPVSDGLGLAAADLKPGSVHLQKLARFERKPGVRYSILAGNGPIVSETALKKLESLLDKQVPLSKSGDVIRQLLAERISYFVDLNSGKGDGIVPLNSTKLDGVEDHVILPLSHVKFLKGTDENGNIYGMDELLERLPAGKNLPPIKADSH